MGQQGEASVRPLRGERGHWGLGGARQNIHSGTDRLADLAGFGSNPGNLKARMYLPRELRAGAPLIVILHGCTQTAADYDYGSGWSYLADDAGVAMLFPEQQRANNPNLCFNWFMPAHSRRGAGEPLSIRQMIEKVVIDHHLDRTRIFVTGLSAGGAMASVMLATYPEVFAGGAIIAGLPYGCAATIPEAFNQMRGGGPAAPDLPDLVRKASSHAGPWPTISIWHGTADETVVPANSDAILRQWLGVHGFSERPTSTEIVAGYPRRAWRDGNDRERIEAYSITGMGHGTPVLPREDQGYGNIGPYMLNAHISSTRHISNFWGLTASSADRTAKPAEEQAASSYSWLRGVGGIQKTITDALRAAGLMQK